MPSPVILEGVEFGENSRSICHHWEMSDTQSCQDAMSFDMLYRIKYTFLSGLNTIHKFIGWRCPDPNDLSVRDFCRDRALREVGRKIKFTSLEDYAYDRPDQRTFQ